MGECGDCLDDEVGVVVGCGAADAAAVHEARWAVGWACTGTRGVERVVAVVAVVVVVEVVVVDVVVKTVMVLLSVVVAALQHWQKRLRF